MSHFRDELRNFSWNHVLIEQDVNNALDNFLDTFLTLFDLYFPTKTKRMNRNFDRMNEFMTKGLLTSRRQKNLLYKTQLTSPTLDNISHYRTYRNIYNSLLRKSKKLYYETSMHKFKSKPKKNWEILKQATGFGRPSSDIQEINDNGNTLTNDFDIATSFNNHFSNVGTEILNSIDPTTIDPLSYIPDNPNLHDFNINIPGPVHVTDVIKSMQCKMSTDCNNISMKLLKFVSYEISVVLNRASFLINLKKVE
jgi:hypothetical protein